MASDNKVIHAKHASLSGTGSSSLLSGEMPTPFMIESIIHQAYLLAWMSLPEDRRTVDELIRVLRQIYERNENALREDAKAFGLSMGTTKKSGHV